MGLLYDYHVLLTLGFVKVTRGTEPLRGDTSQQSNEQYLSLSKINF